MQPDGKLETCPFIGPLFINKKSSREELFQNNHQNGSQSKDFNKNTDTSNTASPLSTISRHRPRVNPVRFEGPYNHINPMENIHEDTHLIDTQKQNIEDAKDKQ